MSTIKPRTLRAVVATIVLLLGGGFSARGDVPPAETSQLTDLSLEELMNIEVTSVSKKAEPLSESAAAIYVITSEDIRRSGARTIADALRMAPGLQVARIDANEWAVTSRGFSGEFANKLLVLIDGRSVYTPLYSGVFWDVQDVVLDDIERIEVIRGPGATLWGANAVNGVINIITREAADSRGSLAQGGGGTEQQGFGSFRHGWSLGANTYARAYGKYVGYDNLATVEGEDAADGWDALRFGFRIDHDLSAAEALTVQGDIYTTSISEEHYVPVLTPPYYDIVEDHPDNAGGNLLTRYSRQYGPDADLALQIYFDRTERHGFYLWENRNTFDVDFQHRFRLWPALEVVWGLGYRMTDDYIGEDSFAKASNARRSDDLPSAFLQGEWRLWDERVRLTAGTKFEHNDYTGFEYQPNSRLLWLPHEKHALWAAVSRAVRTPSRFEHDVRVPFLVYPPETSENPLPMPVLLAAYGDEAFASEELLAYEFGYRLVPCERMTLDLALFYNEYDQLRAGEPATAITDSTPSYHLVIPFVANNDMEGEVYGGELAVDWDPLEWLRLRAAYSHLEMDLRTNPGSDAQPLGGEEGGSPERQLSLRAGLDLLPRIDLDFWLRHVGELPALGIDSYEELDVRLAWQAHHHLELSLVGQNLLQEQHAEFTSEITDEPIQVQRGFYLAATVGF
ncbi:MAG: TonB-dependent receptor plug domain-containing protein [Candidatus Eisenbacteria bacterium]|nr:TonB-dependent receptor plug domain-containing protein [Candidatus Eisenbacteria bacterium]